MTRLVAEPGMLIEFQKKRPKVRPLAD